MTANGHDPCPSCRGHGWKFLTLRRSPNNGGGSAERAMLERPRAACLACSGTGQATAE
jgi:DnaJ-class molecular chaperone